MTTDTINEKAPDCRGFFLFAFGNSIDRGLVFVDVVVQEFIELRTPRFVLLPLEAFHSHSQRVGEKIFVDVDNEFHDFAPCELCARCVI